MATIININPEAGDYLQKVQIDGQTYRVRAQWEDRTESWYLWLGTVSEWLVAGTRATAGRQTFRRVSDDMPPGAFSLLDLDGQGDPLADDLGVRVLLLYDEDGLPEVEDDLTTLEVS